MATIIKHIDIDASAAAVWDVVADFGAIHTRFAPGFVTDVTLEPGARVVTFASGTVFRELFLGSEPDVMRLAYAIRDSLFEHHSASFQVEALGEDRCRLHWVADLLPDALGPTVAGMMAQGLEIAQQTLGRRT